jgi:hypothetical protein
MITWFAKVIVGMILYRGSVQDGKRLSAAIGRAQGMYPTNGLSGGLRGSVQVATRVYYIPRTFFGPVRHTEVQTVPDEESNKNISS